MRQTDRMNTGKLYRLATFWVVLVALGCLSASPSVAQSGASPAELRRANDRLRERITELEAALAESQRRIESLESQIDALTEAPGVLPPDAPPQQPAPVEPADRPIPTEASSCPDSLYGSLVDNYNETFPGIELPALTDVQQWIRRVSKERRRVDWFVHAHETTVAQGNASSILVNLVNPESGEAICNNFTIPVSYLEAKRIRNATEIEIWKLTGTFAANPVVDRSRPEFDNEAQPRLIGPYAVFGWTFDVQSINPVEQTDDPEASEPAQR